MKLSALILLCVWNFFACASSSGVNTPTSSSEVKSDLIPGVGQISTYEKPFQLVDALGDKLRILPEGLHQLRSIMQSLDVISVVGPFHSGKSYLLNRIMNCEREYAFELGYTVDPTTKGIWMQVAYLSGGSAVAFLDTEGFAASDRTADYDAKIFSLAALLSSHLIYNSVRIIDASAVEYLELLARRARLFQMKTALSGGTQNRMNLQKPIAFPPLTWVVEDFFQDFPEGETPKMWLDRVLDAQPSDGAERTSLRDIFASTDCFPLFLPATSSKALRALDALEPAELTGEYNEGLSSLREYLTSSLHVLRNPQSQEIDDASYHEQKTHGAKWTSGTHMAAILELLVDAANTNKMDSIPSLWTLFLERQVSQAMEAAKVIFDKEVRTVLQVSLLPPLTETEFTEHARNSSQVAHKLFSELLFGTASTLTSNATEVLQAVFDKQTGDFAHKNQMLIVEFCREEGRRVVEKFKEKLKAYSLPQAEKKLKASMKAEKETALSSMQEKLKKYSAGSALENTKASLLNLCNELVTTNQGEIDQVLDEAKEAATGLYTKLTKDVLEDGPIGMETLEDVHKKAEQEATIKFGTRAALMKEEKTYKGHEAQYLVEIHKRFEKLKTENKKIVKDVCSAKMSTSITQLEHALHQLAAELPMEEQELVQLVMQRIDMALADFDQKTNEFKKFPERHEVQKELEGECNELKSRLQNENLARWTSVVKKPLQRARKLVNAAKPNFWFGISLRKQAYQFANDEISEHLNELGTNLKKGLKHKVIQKWLDSNPSQAGYHEGVRDIIESKISTPAMALAFVTIILGCLITGIASSSSGAPKQVTMDREVLVEIERRRAKISWSGKAHPKFGHVKSYLVRWEAKDAAGQKEPTFKTNRNMVYRTLDKADEQGVTVTVQAVYEGGKTDDVSKFNLTRIKTRGLDQPYYSPVTSLWSTA